MSNISNVSVMLLSHRLFFSPSGWVAVCTSFSGLSRSVHRGSIHSGHPGGPDVTRFHSSFPASEKSRRTQQGRHYLSVASSLHPSIHASIPPSPWWTCIIGHIINFTVAVWVQVLSELSEDLCQFPKLKGYKPRHTLTPRLCSALYYRAADTFLMVTLDGHNPRTAKWEEECPGEE